MITQLARSAFPRSNTANAKCATYQWYPVPECDAYTPCMFDAKAADSMATLAVFHGKLISLRKFDEAEVDPVCRGQISLSPVEECRVVQYLRVQRNIDSMIALAHVAHFQALSMIARSIFELTIDLRLIPSVPNAAERMKCFQELERLRAAKAAIERSKEPNGSPVSTRLSDFEATGRDSIEARASQLWGTKLNDVRHWSGLNLKKRVSQIADDDISHVYVYTYRTMSWQTHPGLQGSYGLPASAFPKIANSALHLGVFAYLEVLRLMISALGLDKHDPLIGAKLHFAHMLPDTESSAEELELRQNLGL